MLSISDIAMLFVECCKYFAEIPRYFRVKYLEASASINFRSVNDENDAGTAHGTDGSRGKLLSKSIF